MRWGVATVTGVHENKFRVITLADTFSIAQIPVSIINKANGDHKK